MRKVAGLLLCALLLSACVPEVVRHNEAGNEHFAGETYDEAIDEYRLAQVAEPDQAEPYYNAANAYNRTGQVDAALAQTDQALKTADPELAAQTWYNLGNAYFDAQQWPPAIQAYQEALRLRPGDEDAKHNLELALQKLQEQSKSQNQDQEDQKEQEQSEDDQGQPSPTPTPESDAASPEEQETGEEQQQPAGEPQEDQQMTPEQAMQLLQALLDDSETLQERLQQIYEVPGPPPAKDW